MAARISPARESAHCQKCGVSHEMPPSSRTCTNSRILTWRTNSGAARAINLVNNAVRRGHMPKAKDLDCVDCGKPAHDYDHRDYNKPLDVVPVCRSCNLLRGPAIWRNADAA